MIKYLLLLQFLLLSASCVTEDVVSTANQSINPAIPECVIDDSIQELNDPQTIEELVELINALPKPLEVECLFQSLRRPLYVNATSSRLSVQPAVGPENPRVFIVKGSLLITTAPAGEGKDLLEFSELKSNRRSIKGELPLPIRTTVSSSDPYRIYVNQVETTCSGCHRQETLDFTIDDVPVYSSLAIKPTEPRDVSLFQLENELYLCNFNQDTSKRCRFFKSILSYGEVRAWSFPTEMATFLESIAAGQEP